MKLFNLFKKETKKVATSTATKLDNQQLEKVIGGNDSSEFTITRGKEVDKLKEEIKK